jgi:hypothetical protein
MGDLDLEQLAAEHFLANSKDTLIKHICSTMNEDNIFSFLKIDNILVKQAVAKQITKKLNNPEFSKKIVQGMYSEPKIRQGILETLSFSELNKNSQFLAPALENLKHDNANVRKAAACVVAYHYPEHADKLIDVLRIYNTIEIAHIACMSENSSIVLPIIPYLKSKQRTRGQIYSPVLGFLITPQWLASEYKNHPKEIEELISEFGYSNAPVCSKTIDLLSQGHMFVSDAMIDSSQTGFQTRISQFAWSLLPFSTGPANTYVKTDDAVDESLFLAAVRQADISNLTVKKKRNTFKYNSLVSTLTCAHTPYRFFKRKLIDEPTKSARTLGVDRNDIGIFLVDYAKVSLETDNEAKVEADILVKAKWIAISKNKTMKCNPSEYPIKKESDFPLAKYGVIREFKLPAKDSNLSVGANSAVNVTDYLGISGVKEKLLELEEIYSKFLAPVGCEIQIPKGDSNKTLCWKQALRYFGIPSPRRPEYEYMVEAAFRPSKTFHSQIVSIASLYQLGVIAFDQDCAYHISIQGNLGDDARYIVFPYTFIHPRKLQIKSAKERYRKIAPLMSKGIIHINNDVESCTQSGEKPELRTEMRVCACSADEIDDGVKLRLSYIDDIIAVQLLSSALKSEDGEFKSIFESYKNELSSYTEHLDSCFKELLHSNWLESTGDPRDGYLVSILPIIKKREQVFEILKENKMGPRLEQDFSNIINRHAKQIHDMFIKKFSIDYNWENMPLSASLVPYYLPEELIQFSDGKHMSLNKNLSVF